MVTVLILNKLRFCSRNTDWVGTRYTAWQNQQIRTLCGIWLSGPENSFPGTPEWFLTLREVWNRLRRRYLKIDPLKWIPANSFGVFICQKPETQNLSCSAPVLHHAETECFGNCFRERLVAKEKVSRIPSVVIDWGWVYQRDFARENIKNPEKKHFFSFYGLILHQAETECSGNCFRECLLAKEKVSRILSVVNDWGWVYQRGFAPETINNPWKKWKITFFLTLMVSYSIKLKPNALEIVFGRVY